MALLTRDAFEQRADLGVVGVVALHRNALPARRRDGLGGPVDAAGHHLPAQQRAAGLQRATGHVDGHPRRTQR
ncbi:hypothetical protein D9M71_521070 [compost metagenome]